MKCPKCKAKVKMLNTHTLYDKNRYTRTMRRYLCEVCNIKFTTNEIIDIESIKNANATYEMCFTEKEYDDQDCSKCPYLKECGGA